MTAALLENFERNTLPIIRQNEASECGLACVAMILGYYGHNISLGILRRRFSLTLRGMNLKQVIAVADAVHLTSRPLKMPLDGLAELKLPAILHWNLNHFVVLKEVTKSGFIVCDPASGIRKLSPEQMSASYTGIALELEPTKRFQKAEEKLSLKISDLWGKISGLKTGLLQLIILSLFMQAYVLISPFFLQTVIDEVLKKSNTDLLYLLAIGFAGFAVIYTVTQILRDFLIAYVGSTISFQVGSNLFLHLVNLPVSYFEKRHMGDVVSRFQSIGPIRMMLTEGLISTVIDGIMAITTLALMFMYSPILALVSLGLWFLYLIVRLAFYRTMRNYTEAAIASQAEEETVFMEALHRITNLKLFGAERDRHRLWQNLYAREIQADIKRVRLQALLRGSSKGIVALEQVVLVLLAVKMVMKGDFTVGMLFAFMSYRLNFSTVASAIIERVLDFKLIGLYLERMADIVHTEPEGVFYETTGMAEQQLQGKLELKDVSFSYSRNDPEILKSVSLTINPGESIALVGDSGCGKSTLLKILTSLIQPTSGQVYVDGIPLSQFGYANFRRQIGVVMQDDGLLSGSLQDNIAFFDTDIDPERVRLAAKQAQILDDILLMPMQFESLVGDMGAALSGGQKQRLSVARALYRMPKILFMDEGTSHLDVGTEAKLNEVISKLGMTRIIVAHRPETIRSVDRVIAVAGGNLYEAGNVISLGGQEIDLRKKEISSSSRGIDQYGRPRAEAGSTREPINQGAAS